MGRRARAVVAIGAGLALGFAPAWAGGTSPADPFVLAVAAATLLPFLALAALGRRLGDRTAGRILGVLLLAGFGWTAVVASSDDAVAGLGFLWLPLLAVPAAVLIVLSGIGRRVPTP